MKIKGSKYTFYQNSSNFIFKTFRRSFF